MKNNSLFYQILSVLFSRFLVKLIGILTISILILVLTPEEMGVYGLFISSLFLAGTLGNLGVKHSIIRTVSLDSVKFLKPCINSTKKHIVLLVMLTTLIMFCFMFSTVSKQGLSLSILIPILLSSVLFLIINLQQGIYLGLGNVNGFNLLEVTPRLLFLIMVFMSVYVLNLNITENVITLYFIALLCSVLFSLKSKESNIFLAKNRNASNEVNQDFELIKNGLPYCIALFVILANSRVPLYLGDVYFSKDVVGKLFAASRLNDMVLEASTAASLIFFSASAKNISLKEMFRSFSIVIVLMIFGAIVLSVLLRMEFFIKLIPDYVDSIEYLKVLLVGVPFVALNKMLYGVISGKGKPLTGFFVYVVAITLQIVFFYIFGKNSDPIWLVYSLVASQVFIAFLLSIYTYFFIRKGFQYVSQS